MYFCGPTVYQRAHVGNARAVRHRRRGWRDWLRERGYDVTLVHNITDVNDKIYEAAPGASAELAARGDRSGTSRTRDRFGLEMPDDVSRRRPRRSPRSSR